VPREFQELIDCRQCKVGAIQWDEHAAELCISSIDIIGAGWNEDDRTGTLTHHSVGDTPPQGTTQRAGRLRTHHDETDARFSGARYQDSCHIEPLGNLRGHRKSGVGNDPVGDAAHASLDITLELDSRVLHAKCSGTGGQAIHGSVEHADQPEVGTSQVSERGGGRNRALILEGAIEWYEYVAHGRLRYGPDVIVTKHSCHNGSSADGLWCGGLIEARDEFPPIPRLIMEWFIKAFIRASLLWFALGVVLGLAMAAHPPWVVYRPAHAHMNVVGFITMMVFGVGYQLLPRLFGHSLYDKRLGIAHWWLANAGLALMVVGFLMAPHVGSRSAPVTTSGGVFFVLGALAFVYNLWRTFDLADARYRKRAAATERSRILKTVDD